MIITATDSSGSLINIYKTTWRHIPRHSAMIHTRYSPACQRGSPGSFPLQCLWDLWWKCRHWEGFSLQELPFFPHQCHFTNRTDSFIYRSCYITFATDTVTKYPTTRSSGDRSDNHTSHIIVSSSILSISSRNTSFFHAK